MKGFLTIALLSLLMASTHVSSAQEESPGRKATIENQLSAPATIDFQFTPALAKTVFIHPLEPACKVIAYADVAQPAGLVPTCAADADYGNCSSYRSTIENYRLPAKRLLAFTGSPLIHSSGGLPFSWLS